MCNANEEIVTFSGQLEDPCLNFMAIDRFLMKCEVFLISHHHWDHLKGLRDVFEEFNKSQGKYVYCSTLTKEFLCNSRCGILSDKIIDLKISKPFNVYELDQSYVTVTALPAAHCPGSVMFLIEYNNKKILYTGDFRMTLKDFQKCQKFLLNSNKSIKRVDELYLDTTFAESSNFDDFSSREDSEKVLIDLVEEWFLNSVEKKNKVIIQLSACIGNENLFITLSRKFKTKIFVHQNEYNQFYRRVEEIEGYIEPILNLREDRWLIHACQKNCRLEVVDRNFRVRFIKPCVLGFYKNQYQSSSLKMKYNVPYIQKDTALNSFIKIFYSNHCSRNELIDIVNFINPRTIYYNTYNVKSYDVIDRLFKKEVIEENCDQEEDKFPSVQPTFNNENQQLECKDHKTSAKLRLL